MAKQITYGDEIDPTKVVRCVLGDAVSVASLLLTTEAVIFPAENESSRDGTVRLRVPHEARRGHREAAL